jgi:hypothetical protein
MTLVLRIKNKKVLSQNRLVIPSYFLTLNQDDLSKYQTVLMAGAVFMVK